MNDMLSEQFDDCKEIFVEQKFFWRWLVSGLLVVITLALGVLAWSYTPISDVNILKVQQQGMREDIREIRAQYKTIDRKLDLIMNEVHE